MRACPDTQWRLLVALCRYGGPRCPSEHLRLRWEDIDWERGRMIVDSPKNRAPRRQGTPRCAHLPRTAAPSGSGVRRGPGGHRVCHRPIPAAKRQSADSLDQVHQTGGALALANALSQPAGKSADGTAGTVPLARGLRLDGQQPADCTRILPAGDRRPLSASDLCCTYCCSRWPKRPAKGSKHVGSDCSEFHNMQGA